ncbi:MAG: hypothetical protein DRI48_02345 [Chloroflexi bacterium]|nr:MAG: hypothetical protein DRI48_02345 [Chloroflexota bacterium]
MQIVHDLNHACPASQSHVTVGVFDGVHRGHQRLIGGMVEAAHSLQNLAVAVTFDPHPAVVLGHEPLPLLTTLEERTRLLAALGLDVLAVLPFTPAMAHTPATDFVESLIRHLHMVELWGGSDFALGHRREGSIPFLRRLGKERGFAVRVVEPLMLDGHAVNSSRVRAALQEGDVGQAMKCLGRPYRLTGVVVRGRGVGQSMGVPTANISPPPTRLIPANGVYACVAYTGHLHSHRAVTNIGTRPTFADKRLVVEAHLLDFEAHLYDQVLTLDFIARLRDELAFPTLNALVGQIQEDITRARDILTNYSPASA